MVTVRPVLLLGRSRRSASRGLLAAAVLTGLLTVAAGGIVADGVAAGGVAADPAAGAPDDDSRFSLTLSPARLVVPPHSGVVQRTVTVDNTGKTPLDLHLAFSGFRQQRSGAIIFGRPGATSEASWIDARPAAFHLALGGEQHVRMRIDVPAAAEPGEHTIGVVFLVPADTSSENLTINRGVGTQLLVRAPGPVVHDIKLTGLHTPGLSTGGHIPVTLTLRNSGTVHEDLLRQRRILGRADGKRLAFPNLTVLAQTTRLVSADWSDPPWLCHCEIVVSAPDGHGGTSTVRTSVWVLPLYQALGVLLFGIGVSALVRWRRTRNATALATARQQGYEAASKQPV